MPKKPTGRPPGRPRYPDILTPAEQRVLDLLREGLPNAEIAVRLGISPDGVKYHVSNMLSKLHLERREQLAAWRPSQPSLLRRAWAAIPLLGKLVTAGGLVVAVGAFTAVVALGGGDTKPAPTPDIPEGLASVGFDGSAADGNSTQPSLSRDGRFVAFQSDATNLVPGDTNGQRDVFVRDRLKNTTVRVSVASNGDQADGPSGDAVMSADGRFVAFDSSASNLVANSAVTDDEALAAMPPQDAAQLKGQPSVPPAAKNNFLHRNVFIHDLQTHRTELASVALDGRGGNLPSSWPSLSADGRFVAFHSLATNLVENDTNSGKGGIAVTSAGPGGGVDVFVRDREKGTMVRVSVTSDGTQADGSSGYASISADGSRVAFVSDAANLLTSDYTAFPHAHIHDLKTGNTKLVTFDLTTMQLARMGPPQLSSDGTVVAVRAYAFTNPPRNAPTTVATSANRLIVYDAKTDKARILEDGRESGFLALANSGDAHYAVTFGEAQLPNPYSGLALVDLTTGDRHDVDPPAFKKQGTVLYGPALSPDGSTVAYSVADAAGISQVYVQPQMTSALRTQHSALSCTRHHLSRPRASITPCTDQDSAKIPPTRR